MHRLLLAATLAAATPLLAQTASFDPDNGYNVGRSLANQPDGQPKWQGSGELFTVVPEGDGGAAQSAATDQPNFSNLRLVPAGVEAKGQVPFSLKLRGDAPPTSKDFAGAWFIRIGHDDEGNATGNAVRIGIFDNGIVQTENQAGGGTTRMLDADGDAIDLDDLQGRFVTIEGVINFDAETYTLSFDGVEQTFNGSTDLPFAQAGQDAFGMVSLNSWNSDDPQSRQISIDDLTVGEGQTVAAAEVQDDAVQDDAVALPVPRPRPAGDDVPAGGMSLLPESSADAFFAGNHGPDKSLASVEVVELEDGPTDEALRVVVGNNPSPTPAPWHVEVKTRQIAPTSGGDLAMLRFWARTIESQHETAAAEFDVYYQHAGRPYDPSFMYRATPGSEWTRYDIPFDVFRTYGDGRAELNFAAGLREQTFELAGIELISFAGSGVTMDALPKTTQDYPGRADDAPWRIEAHERIAELRTGPITVKVVDADGQPVAGEEVQIEMTRSAFEWGTAVSAEIWRQDNADAEKYRQEVLRLFNTASTENGLKIHRWYDLQRREETMKMIRDLDDAGLNIHGHVLVWPSWRKTRVPLDRIQAEAEAGDVEGLRWITNEFIRDVTLDTRGLIDAWDVMNEPWNNNDFMRLMGESEMTTWFEQADEYVPETVLYINDFGILNGPPFESNDHAIEYHRVIDLLVNDDAPLEAIGFQAHFGSLIPPAQMMETIAAFEGFGKRFAITEYDARTSDEEAYADHMRDLMTIAYAHEQFDAFIMWGFWDKPHWLKNAPLYHEDWTPKAGLAMWEKLVLNDWHTSETATTSSDGTVQVTGHHGSYRITIGDETVEVDHRRDESATVEVRLQQ
jgi:GH35 family endo-1,4-beta-xylanase